jgi:uncharacterized surface protein with fasciclin (FAS1) repeats
MSKSKLLAVLAATSLVALTACGADTAPVADTTPPTAPAETTPTETPADTIAQPGTIVEVAAANGSFATLVAAVQAAGLVETLSSEGPFTVFAPSDAAFAALPEGLVEKLLLPENKDVLVRILTYHVLGQKVLAADVTAAAVATVEGSELTITTENGVKVNDATVVGTDVLASNGVIHVIDKVLLPAGLDISAL